MPAAQNLQLFWGEIMKRLITTSSLIAMLIILLPAFKKALRLMLAPDL